MNATSRLLSELRQVDELRTHFRKWWEDHQLSNVLLINVDNIRERFNEALAVTNLPNEVKNELIAERERLLRIATLLHDAREIWHGREP
jgi:hypothetical protein